jgi:hypothetical protein
VLIGDEAEGECDIKEVPDTDVDGGGGGGKVGGFPLSDIPFTWSWGKPIIALGGGNGVEDPCLIRGLVSWTDGMGLWYAESVTLAGGNEEGDGCCGAELEEGVVGDCEWWDG